ncbi:MAG: enoyl-CoA hydratase/isomerase family protein [Firmicutes bacterium]|nr:enoyl-CoA hydratase/isomerase family protein [Bacillota bacterium]
MSENVITVEKRNNIALLTLNRPPLNPLSSAVFRALKKIITALEDDTEIKAVIITGSGEKAFAAGVDIAEITKLSPVEIYDFNCLALSAFTKFENLNKPTIAAINGLALGGGYELALTCDFRIAGTNAKFAQPEINLGIIPGGGATQRLPRLIGVARAKELLFLGDTIDSATAERYGMVNKVVPPEKLLADAEELAKRLAAKPTVAMKMMKKTVNLGMQMDLSSATNLEIESFVIAFATDDRVEGIKALLEKRKPNFTGK